MIIMKAAHGGGMCISSSWRPEHAFGHPLHPVWLERDRNLLCFAVEGMHPVQGQPILVDILKFERKFGIFTHKPLNFGPHYVHCNEDLNDVAWKMTIFFLYPPIWPLHKSSGV